jgi:hypothetical protein
MKKKIFFILLIVALFLASSLLIKKKDIEPFNNGYLEACKELVKKRNFLRDYVQRLRTPVQDLKTIMTQSRIEKQNNMAFQRIFTEKCSNLTPAVDELDSSSNFRNNSTIARACRALASVDKYQLEILPDVDIFYATVLLENDDKLTYALKLINFYTNLMKCPIPDSSRVTLDSSENVKDADGNTVNQNTRIEISRDIGSLNTRELVLELEKLSPYYLSPDVIRYIIRFMISQEKLDYLNDTSADFVAEIKRIMDKITTYYI